MVTEEQGTRSQRKRRVVIGAGIAATAAVGGLGLTATEGQAASTLLHACYSKSTKQLKFSKKAKCPKGSKLVTWGQPGPQGAQGAQGAQGPAATLAGWAGERYGTSSPVAISKGSSTVVAAFEPASSGYFDVTGTANIEGGYGPASCTDFVTDSDYTPAGVAPLAPSPPFNTVTIGIVHAGPTDPVYEKCYLADNSGTAHEAVVTGIHLAAAHVAGVGHARYVPGAAIKPFAARSRFVKKRST